jgi:hypothetical protein
VLADKLVEPLEDPVEQVLQEVLDEGKATSRFQLFGQRWRLELEEMDGVYRMYVYHGNRSYSHTAWAIYESTDYGPVGPMKSVLEVDPTCMVSAYLVRVMAAVYREIWDGSVIRKTTVGQQSWTDYRRRFPFL